MILRLAGGGNDPHMRFFWRASVLAMFIVILIGIVNFFIRRTLALSLEVTEYGFFYSALAFFFVFLAVFDLGLGQSTSILIARHNALREEAQARDVFRTLFNLRVAIAVVLCVGLGFTAPSLARRYFRYEGGVATLRIMGVWLAACMFMGSILAAFEGLKRFLSRNLLLFSYGVLTFVLIMTFRGRLTAFVAGACFTGGALIAALAFAVYLRSREGYPFFARLKVLRANAWAIVHFSKWVAFCTAGWLVIFSMDTLMLTYLSGLKSVALYNVALPIMQIFLSIMLIAPQVFTPMATELWSQRQFDRLRVFSRNVTVGVFGIMAAAVAGLSYMAPRLIAILFDAKFSGAATALILLSAGVPFLIAGQMQVNMLIAAGKQRDGAVIVVAGVLLNIVLNALLIRFWDINGAAAASLITYACIFVAARIRFGGLLRGQIAGTAEFYATAETESLPDQARPMV